MTNTIDQLQDEIDVTAFVATYGRQPPKRSKFNWRFEIDATGPFYGYGTLKQGARAALLKYGKPASTIRLIS